MRSKYNVKRTFKENGHFDGYHTWVLVEFQLKDGELSNVRHSFTQTIAFYYNILSRGHGSRPEEGSEEGSEEGG